MFRIATIVGRLIAEIGNLRSIVSLQASIIEKLVEESVWKDNPVIEEATSKTKELLEAQRVRILEI